MERRGPWQAPCHSARSLCEARFWRVSLALLRTPPGEGSSNGIQERDRACNIGRQHRIPNAVRGDVRQ